MLGEYSVLRCLPLDSLLGDPALEVWGGELEDDLGEDERELDSGDDLHVCGSRSKLGGLFVPESQLCNVPDAVVVLGDQGCVEEDS